jgi:Phosphorylated CTD interacting factor 1 WW domain
MINYYLESVVEIDEIQESSLEQNYEWLRRFEITEIMSNWIKTRLKRMGKYDKRPRSASELRNKAKDYLYAHIMHGKMIQPLGSDPLFCEVYFENSTLVEQLRGGRVDYHDFVRKMNYLVKSHRANFNSYSTVVSKLRKNIPLRTMQRLLNSLSPDIDDNLKTILIDGLLLRYACVGALWSSLHGSVPLEMYCDSGDYIECFASPFNRRLETYYSIFDEDCEHFGSSGNFFRMVEENGGMLRENTKYEMNPPFDLDLMNRVAEIIRKTFTSNKHKNIAVCAFFPNWAGAEYTIILDRLTLSASGFTAKKTNIRQTYTNAYSNSFTVPTIIYQFG